MPLRFLAVLIVFALSFSAEAQQGKKVPRLDRLFFVRKTKCSGIFRQLLWELGYLEGEQHGDRV